MVVCFYRAPFQWLLSLRINIVVLLSNIFSRTMRGRPKLRSRQRLSTSQKRRLWDLRRPKSLKCPIPSRLRLKMSQRTPSRSLRYRWCFLRRIRSIQTANFHPPLSCMRSSRCSHPLNFSQTGWRLQRTRQRLSRVVLKSK